MPIVFKCPGCGKIFKVKDGLSGKSVQCQCSAKFKIPYPKISEEEPVAAVEDVFEATVPEDAEVEVFDANDDEQPEEDYLEEEEFFADSEVATKPSVSILARLIALIGAGGMVASLFLPLWGQAQATGIDMLAGAQDDTLQFAIFGGIGLAVLAALLALIGLRFGKFFAIIIALLVVAAEVLGLSALAIESQDFNELLGLIESTLPVAIPENITNMGLVALLAGTALSFIGIIACGFSSGSTPVSDSKPKRSKPQKAARSSVSKVQPVKAKSPVKKPAAPFSEKKAVSPVKKKPALGKKKKKKKKAGMKKR